MVERELSFDASLHSGDAVQRATYKLSDRLSCDISVTPHQISCRLHLPEAPEDELAKTLADFRNEVLDESLRERIREETRDVRTIILALAFSNTGLVDSTAGD